MPDHLKTKPERKNPKFDIFRSRIQLKLSTGLKKTVMSHLHKNILVQEVEVESKKVSD